MFPVDESHLGGWEFSSSSESAVEVLDILYPRIWNIRAELFKSMNKKVNVIFVNKSSDAVAFSASCTPRYLNRKNKAKRTKDPFTGQPMLRAFFEILKSWRNTGQSEWMELRRGKETIAA